MGELLALSLLQPWLWAILESHKGVTIRGRFLALENRSWKPPRLMLGRTLALHASAGWDAAGEEFVLMKLIGRNALVPSRQTGQRGAILGTARIVAAIRPEGSRGEVSGPITDADVDELAASPWAFGPWIWVLADVVKIPEPIPCKGMLGFWRVPEDVAARVRELEVARG